MKKDALEYHREGRPGKICVQPTKETSTQRDLSLAYSPGVAEPCLAIEKTPNDAYQYTNRANLVAVISDGTAVLGLGNIGPLASKPVMEGKAVLFKIFSDIDVFDIELDVSNTEQFIQTVKALEPTFGGINLEDIKAPECFIIEERLKKELKIPVMHDDQHGTAIISGAALLNAVEIAEKRLEDIQVVVSGAGASAISCIRIYEQLGVQKKNIVVIDSKGVIHKKRSDLNGYKKDYATDKPINTLQEALVNADLFLGLSIGGIMKPEMLLSMAQSPIVFALANPTPEIDYHLALETRPDVIMATGRSDFPNQVNNVLGFPFIFRGALDVRATQINEAMKLAAVKALAELSKKPVPYMVKAAYRNQDLSFGKLYFIPKPLDPRLLSVVAPAVAQAAIDTKVAQAPFKDIKQYAKELNKRIGKEQNLFDDIFQIAKATPKKVLFADADNEVVMKAAEIALKETIAKPILLGRKTKLNRLAQEHNINIEGMQIIDPNDNSSLHYRSEFMPECMNILGRKGYSVDEVKSMLRHRQYFSLMMLHCGHTDALLSGYYRKYAHVLRNALDIIGTANPDEKVASMYILKTKRGYIFLADTTVNPEPSSEDIVSITRNVINIVEKGFNITPRVALLSYSNFGSSDFKGARKMSQAANTLRALYPNYIIDGEIQANLAFNQKDIERFYPFSPLAQHTPNILIFPNLSAANISHKLLDVLGGIESIGPMILGMRKPIHILQIGSSVKEILNMVALAVADSSIKKG